MENMKKIMINKNIEVYKDGKLKEIKDLVIREVNFDIYLNNKFYITVMCLENNLKEFIVGFMFFENIIETYQDIKSIEIVENEKRINVCLYKEINKNINEKKILTTGCGKSIISSDIDIPVKCKKIDLVFNISKNKIINIMKKFSQESDIFAKTGGVHSCALSNGDDILFFADDVGRHNAFDKVIGYCLINDIDTSQKIVLTTGRVSSEIMAKTIKSKIAIIVSRSAVTDYAIKLAENFLITLIGFARGSKLNIYSFSERIIFDD